MALVLFAYAFVSNLALAVVPHEPVVIWYGVHWGVWPTALVATAGTVAASAVDHRMFVPLVGRLAMQPVLTSGMVGKIRGCPPSEVRRHDQGTDRELALDSGSTWTEEEGLAAH